MFPMTALRFVLQRRKEAPKPAGPPTPDVLPEISSTLKRMETLLEHTSNAPRPFVT